MRLFINGQECELTNIEVEITRISDRLIVKTADGSQSALAIRKGDSVLVSYLGRQFRIERNRPRSGVHGVAASGEMRAPMPGQIVDVLVDEGASVQKGDKILVLEAMKTQQPFTAPFEGTVSKLSVSKGDQVLDGALLAIIQPLAEPE